MKLDLDRHYHGDLVQLYEDGDWNEILVLASRGHYKSHILAGYLAWRICLDRNFRAMVVGVNLIKASEIVFLTRQSLMRKNIRAWFGEFETDIWGLERFIVSGRGEQDDGGEGRAEKEATLACMGIDAFRQGGHFHVVVFEDVDDHERTQSFDVIEQTRRADRLAYSMADLRDENRRPVGKRITIGTFYSGDDLYHHKLEHLGLYSYEDDLPVVRSLNRSASGKKVVWFKPATLDGKKLSFWTQEELDEKKAELGPSEYALQYDLNIMGNEDSPFKESDFVFSDAIPAKSTCFIGYDAARSKKRGSDYTGRTIVFIDPEGVWHVTEAKRKRMDAAEFIAMWERDLQAFPEAEYVIEEDAYIAGLRGQIEAMFRKIRIYPRCTWVPAPSRPRKDPRILALQGLFRSKSIVFTRGQTEQAKEELLPFPGPGRRDVCDSLANILEIARTPSNKRRHRDDGEGLTRETRWMRKLMETEEKESHRNPRGAQLTAREN